MKKTILAFCAVVAVAVFAQENQNDIKANASKSAVEEVLSQPDGVSIIQNEKDGSLQIFARGSATYDFGDARDIRSKTKIAEIRAKAALSKFYNETVKVEESATSGEGRMSKAMLTQTESGEVVKKTISRENVETIKETLIVRASSILSGVVTLKTIKIPTKGSKTSGEIQVTVGISTKTLDAAAEAYNMIIDSLNSRRKIGDRVPQNGCGNKANKNTCTESVNNVEVKINNTIF